MPRKTPIAPKTRPVECSVCERTLRGSPVEGGWKVSEHKNPDKEDCPGGALTDHQRPRPKFTVVCDDYQVSFPTRSEAEDALARFIAHGGCPHPHRIVEVQP